MEANYKREITKLQSDINIKQGIFDDTTTQLRQLQEQNMQLETDIEVIEQKEQKATKELSKKDADFSKMGESLAIQA